MEQRDFGYVKVLPSLQDAVFVDEYVIKKFKSYREAVIWAWQNRVSGKGMTDTAAQSFFCRHYGYIPSHFSRAVNENTKAPMDLKNDFRADFEAYVGNRAVTQYMSRQLQATVLEEIQASRRA